MIKDLSNLAPVYFHEEEIREAQIGPIELQLSVPLHGRGLTVTRDVSAGECLMLLPATLAAPVQEVYQAYNKNYLQQKEEEEERGGGGGERVAVKQQQQQSVVEVLAERILMKSMQQRLLSYSYEYCDDNNNTDNNTSNRNTLSRGVCTKLLALLLQVGDESMDRIVTEVIDDSTDIIIKQQSSSNHNHKETWLMDVMMEKSVTAVEDDCRLILDRIYRKLIVIKEEEKSFCCCTLFDNNNNEELIMKIMRRNIFGPEFYSHETIENSWEKKAKESTDDIEQQPYKTILGFYPLAAMINHSCVPNAVRVFVGDTMIVHASSNIAKGEEILWSYTALNQTVDKRQTALLKQFGFTCFCDRCKKEEEVTLLLRETLGSKFCSSLDSFNASRLDLSSSTTVQAHRVLKRFRALSHKLDRTISRKSVSNETTRYLKAGYLSFYMNYLNLVLQLSSPSSSLENDTDHNNDYTLSYETDILPLASYLHFTCIACNNASTEHLSIIHLCYDVVSLLKSKNSNDDNNQIRAKFWTEQLKKSVMTRYGYLGNNIDNVRMAMQHSKGILRTYNGFHNARYKFI